MAEKDTISLIKELIGNRSLRQVETEAGISHGLLGRVLRGEQKPSANLLKKLTDAKSNPQGDVDYVLLLKSADYITVESMKKYRDISHVGAYYDMLLGGFYKEWKRRAFQKLADEYHLEFTDDKDDDEALKKLKSHFKYDLFAKNSDGNIVWITYIYSSDMDLENEVCRAFGKTVFSDINDYIFITNNKKAIEVIAEYKNLLRNKDLNIEVKYIPADSKADNREDGNE